MFSVSLNCKTKPIYTKQTHHILEISSGTENIGYIDARISEDFKNGVITPFTTDGRELPATDCPHCGIKALFAYRFGLYEEQINVEFDRGALIAKAIIEALF